MKSAYNISIAGSGTADQITNALESVIKIIKKDSFKELFEEAKRIELEDAVLLTEINLILTPSNINS